jgi:hypothetical protein
MNQRLAVYWSILLGGGGTVAAPSGVSTGPVAPAGSPPTVTLPPHANTAPTINSDGSVTMPNGEIVGPDGVIINPGGHATGNTNQPQAAQPGGQNILRLTVP